MLRRSVFRPVFLTEGVPCSKACAQAAPFGVLDRRCHLVSHLLAGGPGLRRGPAGAGFSSGARFRARHRFLAAADILARVWGETVLPLRAAESLARTLGDRIRGF